MKRELKDYFVGDAKLLRIGESHEERIESI